MRNGAYGEWDEGPSVLADRVRAKARDMTTDKKNVEKSVREEKKAIKDYGRRAAAAASSELRQEYRRIQKDEGEHAASFQRESKKIAGFLDVLRRGLSNAGGALKPLAKEPALVAAVAAPLIGAGVNEISKHRAALRQAKAKAENYRTMMELTPRLRVHDQKEIGRIYNTLHNVNPMMGNDPLIAGAWIDNIMENKGVLGETSSHQQLLNAVKDLSGIRSQMSAALRNERGDTRPGSRVESFIAGMGKDVEKAMQGGIAIQAKQKSDELKALSKKEEERLDELRAGVKGEYNRRRAELDALQQQIQGYAQDLHKKASDPTEDELELFFKVAGIT